MTCFHPLKAFRSATVNDSGKRSLVFNSSDALIEGSAIKLPCGQCQGCRSDRAHEWAVRCGHEAKFHDRSCFLTLTYDDQSVPDDFSVKKEHLQAFIKRLRKRAGRLDGSRIRYFACGEYGDSTARPHYHLLAYGFDFPDKKHWSTREGYRTFKSEMLSELWPQGSHEIGSVTHQSAGYVARYVHKKINGARADDHYSRVSPITGQVHRRNPEFALMSLRPGIGGAWFDNFKADAFPSDFVVVDGRKVRPPSFYLNRLAKDEPAALAQPGRLLSSPKSVSERIKRARKRRAAAPEARWNATPERLKVREEVAVARMSRLKRSVD